MNKTTSSTPPALVGRRLGEFELLEKLDSGGFGAIYRAEQVGLRRQAVVKILRSHVAANETAQLRFLREARLASSLDHPYAAHVYAFGVEPDGVLWIAMELVRGTPLGVLLETGPMALATFAPFLERLCEVVQTAHDLGIIHRDLKPQNVMVISRAGALLPKLLDLGIAKDGVTTATLPVQASFASPDDATVATGKRIKASVRTAVDLPTVAERTGDRAEKGDEPRPPKSEPLAPEPRGPRSLTGEGDMMGSPPYMAPEQWTGADLVTTRSDLYSLGVLAYEAISGRRPFSGTIEELARQHLHAPVPPLPDGFPAALNEVLARAMAKDPRDRPESALALARAFSQSRVGRSPRRARPAEAGAGRRRPRAQGLSPAAGRSGGGRTRRSARGAYHALDAATRVARVAVRLLAVIGLAAGHASGATRQPSTAVMGSSSRRYARGDSATRSGSSWSGLWRAPRRQRVRRAPGSRGRGPGRARRRLAGARDDRRAPSKARRARSPPAERKAARPRSWRSCCR